jgi:hypothetical protein
VGLERGPLSLVTTIEDLFEIKFSGSGLESREYGRRDPPCWLRDTPLSAKWVWNGVHSASWLQLRSYLEVNVAAPVYKPENMAVGIRHDDHVAPSISKSWH